MMSDRAWRLVGPVLVALVVLAGWLKVAHGWPLALVVGVAVAAPPHPPARVHARPPVPRSLRWVGFDCSVPELPDGTFAGELDCWDVYGLAGGRHPHRERTQ